MQDEINPNEDETSIEDPHTGPNTGQLVKGDMQMSGASVPLEDDTGSQVMGGNDDDENPIVPAEGDPRDNKLKSPFDDTHEDDDEEELGESIKFAKNGDILGKDIIEGEDPFTSGTGEDQTPELDQPRKQQAQLDDTPLQEEPNDFNNTNGESPIEDLDNTGQDGERPDVATPDHSDMLGDSGQVRLQLEQQGEDMNPDRLATNDGIMNNAGLNMEPDAMRGQYEDVTEEDYLKKTQDGSDVLEQEGEPLEDGAIIMPDDVRQVTPTGTGIDPVTGEQLVGQDMIDTPDGMEDPTQLNPTGADMNDPTHSGIDEEEVDPNILHPDPVEPESGILYTDNTDEQGNEIPDLRFDQTPESDEQQPEIENEFEIVTKEEYEQHVDGAFNSQDEFDAELDNPQMDILETTPEEFIPQEDAMDPTETDEEGNPVEMADVDGNPLEEEEAGSQNSDSQNSEASDEELLSGEDDENSGSDSNKKSFGDAPKESSEDPNDFSDEPEEDEVSDSSEEEVDKEEEPKESKQEDEKPKKKAKKTSKKSPKKTDKKDPDKKESSKDSDEPEQGNDKSSKDDEDEGNINDSKVDAIFDKKDQLEEEGLEDEEILDLLKNEFDDDIVEDIEE